MQSDIDNLFNNIEKETTSEIDILATKLNKYIANKRANFFGNTPHPSKKQSDFNILRKIARVLIKVNGSYDYKDFVKFAIRTHKGTKYEKFPSIKRIATKAKVWETASKSVDLPMHLFNPITVSYNGTILNKDLGTYFGFKTVNEFFAQDASYILLVDRVIKPLLKGKPLESISYKDLHTLEWATASAIRHRHKTELAKTLYLVWKKAKKLERR